MKKISGELTHFLANQGFVIISTIDAMGFPHNACKGIVEIKESGQIYLLDLYHGVTYENLKKNPHIAVTVVDEHGFKGFCLKGKARIIPLEELDGKLLTAWENRITNRLTQRVLRNLSGQKGHPKHPEVLLPSPKYLIEINVKEVIDLTPKHLKGEV